MTTLFSKARNWIRQQLERAAGVSVTYVRTGQSPIAMTAVVGRTVFASNMVNQAQVEFGDRDYLIKATDLTLGEPQIGDRIHETIDGEQRIYEIMTPNTGEPAWRWSDPQHTVYRLHVKVVA